MGGEPSRLVVVGASLAGLRAVEAARAAGFAGEIVLIGEEAHVPYDRPPLSKAFLEQDADDEHPPFRPEVELRDRLGVRLLLGAPATGLDTAAKEVRTDAGAIGYDALVIATGAHARPVPGISGLPGVCALRTRDDADRVRLAWREGCRTVVLGAGFIGSEVASSARARGQRATVVEVADTPLVRALGEGVGQVLAQLHRDNGTDLRLGTGIVSVGGVDRLREVRLTDGSVIPADLLVVGAGAVPSTDWLRGSGVGLDERDGGVLADATLRTSADGVWAAGDVVHWDNGLFGRRMRLEHWTSAAEQGAVAGRNAVSPSAAPYETVPYFWSDWYGHRLQFVGAHGSGAAPEVDVVQDLARDGRHLVLYREGDRFTGAFSIDLPARIMKFRRLLAARASFTEALELARASGAPVVAR